MQAAPVFLNREATVDKACELIAAAGQDDRNPRGRTALIAPFLTVGDVRRKSALLIGVGEDAAYLAGHIAERV